jgi:hypothetical protein
MTIKRTGRHAAQEIVWNLFLLTNALLLGLIKTAIKFRANCFRANKIVSNAALIVYSVAVLYLPEELILFQHC